MGEPQAASTDKSTGLVVVDPVRAFTDPEGVWASPETVEAWPTVS